MFSIDPVPLNRDATVPVTGNVVTTVGFGLVLPDDNPAFFNKALKNLNLTTTWDFDCRDAY